MAWPSPRLLGRIRVHLLRGDFVLRIGNASSAWVHTSGIALVRLTDHAHQGKFRAFLGRGVIRIFAATRMAVTVANQTWQPTPGGRRFCFQSLLARRGCIFR